MSDRVFPRRAIHLDFHTMPSVSDVGTEFDPDEFADTLSDAHVDFITVFAKCNLGFTYYPTDFGIPHPGLQRELLGPMVSACHERGIQVAAYLNTGLDHEHALRHRDWCKVNEHGQVYETDRMGHFFRRMCLNTAYRDYQLALIGEVIDRYSVDGVFLDCFTLTPCYGAECVDGMHELGWDVFDGDAAQEYAWRVTERFIADVEALVEEKRPGIFLYHNGLPYRNQPTHLELEVLPTGGWGYDYLPWAIRFARTVGRPYFTMTGRFHKGWGDFGGLRPKESMLYDCFNSIANGGTCSIGDHMHPRGRLEPEVYTLIGEVYDRTMAFDAWTDGAHSVAEIAVIDPDLFYMARKPSDRKRVSGAARMLIELKQQFDVCDGTVDLSRYRVVVLPDDVRVDDTLSAALRAHIDRGGAVVSTGASGLDADAQGFALADWPVEYVGSEEHDPTFVRAETDVADDIPAMPITVYRQGISVREKPGATVLAWLDEPYFNDKSWDWRHENVYIPPRGESGRPAVVEYGRIQHFAFPLFRGYSEDAVVHHKTLFRNCLTRLLPEPLVRVTGMPSFGQVTVTQQESRTMVHLLSYVPELRGTSAQIVEEPIEVHNVRVSLRIDGNRRTTSRAYLAPDEEELSIEVDERYVTVSVPELSGYAMIVFEHGTPTET